MICLTALSFTTFLNVNAHSFCGVVHISLATGQPSLDPQQRLGLVLHAKMSVMVGAMCIIWTGISVFIDTIALGKSIGGRCDGTHTRYVCVCVTTCVCVCDGICRIVFVG